MFSFLASLSGSSRVTSNEAQPCKQTGGVCKCPKKTGVSGNGESTLSSAGGKPPTDKKVKK